MNTDFIGLSCSAISSLLRRLARQPKPTDSQEFDQYVSCIAALIAPLGSPWCCRSIDSVVCGTSDDSREQPNRPEIVRKITECVATLLSSSASSDAIQQALLKALCDNLPAVITFLLDCFVTVGPDLPITSQHSFLALLLIIPGTPALTALASYLSLLSSSTADAAGGMEGRFQSDGREHAGSPQRSNNTEVFISQRSTSALVQPVLAQFVAYTLAARISAEPVKVGSMLPVPLDAKPASRQLDSRRQDCKEEVSTQHEALVATRPLFHCLLHEAHSLSTPPQTHCHSPPTSGPVRDAASPAAPQPPTPPQPHAAATAPQDDTRMQPMAARMRAHCSRLLGLPDVAAANCDAVPRLLNIDTLLPRLLTDATAAAAATAAPASAGAAPADAFQRATQPYSTAHRDSLDDAQHAAHSTAHSTPCCPAGAGGKQPPQASRNACGDGEGGGQRPAAPCPYDAAVCGLSALLSVAVLRGHADAAAGWCMRMLCERSVDGGDGHAGTRHACVQPGSALPLGPLAAAVASMSETSAHERLWHALLMHASADPHSAGHGTARDGAALHVLGVLWREGTARALPAAQHVALLQRLHTRRGLLLPPPAQVLLVQMVAVHHFPSDASAPGDAGRALTPLNAHTAAPAACMALQPEALEAITLSGAIAPLNTFQVAICGGVRSPEERLAADGSRSLALRMAEAVAAGWAAECDALGCAAPPRAQAATTFLLCVLLAAVGNAGVDCSSGLLRSILKGVNSRLSRGMTDGPSARQGKRVARLFSELVADAAPPGSAPPAPANGSAGRAGAVDDFDGTLGAEEVPQVLYTDEDLSLLPEELWWRPQHAASHTVAAVSRSGRSTRSPNKHQGGNAASAAHGAAQQDQGPLTDSDDSDASSEASIEVAGGSAEDDGPGGGRPLDVDKNWRPVQLHTVAAALRDSKKTVAQVEALSKIEQLVRASPASEVAKAAPELLRTLIYSPPPEWASRQTPTADELHPDRRRIGALAAVLAAAPAAAPGAAISHMFTEGLDVSQRLLVLDGLRAAAHEMAGRPLLAPLTADLGPAGASPSAPAPASALLGGKYNADKTRVWGTATLRKLQGGPAAAAANRFGTVALPWAMDLLTRAAEDTRGARLFRMQAVVFGRMLSTLGTFCHCARLTLDSGRLCSVVMELLLDEAVAEHPDAFVRKSALVATAELLRAVPAARLAGAMVRSHGGGGGGADDAAFAGRLERLQEQLRRTHEAGPDPTLRALAEGCLALQSALAQEAMACLEADAEAAPTTSLPPSASQDILLPPW
eukprot:jgi/Ulvmu1/8720/UM047_0061.1